MALANYTDLQIALSNYLGRDELTARITELIALFEAKVKRRLRLRRMESRATAATTAGVAELALPTIAGGAIADFLEMRNLRLNTDPRRTLIFVPQHQSDWEEPGVSRSGYPRIYRIVGTEIIFGPIPDAAYTVETDYYGFNPLSTSAPTNWLMTEYPDVYLFGSLAQAGGYKTPDPRVPEWAAQCERLIGELVAEDAKARWNGAPLTMRTATCTP